MQTTITIKMRIMNTQSPEPNLNIYSFHLYLLSFSTSLSGNVFIRA